MSSTWLKWSLPLGLWTISGCAVTHQARTEVHQALHHWSIPQISTRAESEDEPGEAGPAQPGDSGKATAPSAEAAAQAGVPEVSDLLRDWLAAALERNPEIRAASAALERAAARVPQAVALEDPMLRAVIRPEPVQTAAGDMDFTLGLSQKFPLPAKLARAGDIAVAEVRAAAARLHRTRLNVVMGVEQAFFSLYRIDRLAEIATANRELLERLAGVVDVRYRVGKASQQELLRLQTEVATLADEEHRLARQRDAAVAALNRFMDAPPDQPRPVIPVFSPSPFDLDAERLNELADEYSPDLAAIRYQLQADQGRAALRDLGYWPDLTLGLEWNHLEGRDAFLPPRNPQTGMRPAVNRKSEVGDDNWAITLAVNLPIWADRVEGAIQEARMTEVQTASELRALENQLAFEIAEAVAGLRERQETLAVLRSTLIPQAKQTYDVAVTAYQAGDVTFIAVIDHWRRWLDYERMLHRQTAEWGSLRAELQRQVGVRLEEDISGGMPANADPEKQR